MDAACQLPWRNKLEMQKWLTGDWQAAENMVDGEAMRVSFCGILVLRQRYLTRNTAETCGHLTSR